MNREALQQLSKDDLIALVLAQADVMSGQASQIALLERRVAELEAKLGAPPKTPDNSSIRLARARSRTGRNGGPRRGRAGRA